ncbi:MAG: aldehyde ferredoxin oxidoreductase C-terminal domain-containing protein [Pseudomonadota bacterium]
MFLFIVCQYFFSNGKNPIPKDFINQLKERNFFCFSPKVEGQVELSRNLQIATAVLDAAGLCVFVAFAILDIKEGLEAIPKMLNARYGWNMNLDDLTRYGQEILKAERAFNLAAGFTEQDDKLPDFFKEKMLPPHNTVFDVPDEELDQVCNY